MNSWCIDTNLLYASIICRYSIITGSSDKVVDTGFSPHFRSVVNPITPVFVRIDA